MIKDVPEVKRNVLLILERFPFYKYASGINRISEDTLKRMRDEDKDFAEECEAARCRGIMKYGGRATPEFILKNADPQTFKDKKEVEVNLPTPLLGADNVHKDNSTVETAETK